MGAEFRLGQAVENTRSLTLLVSGRPKSKKRLDENSDFIWDGASPWVSARPGEAQQPGGCAGDLHWPTATPSIACSCQPTSGRPPNSNCKLTPGCAQRLQVWR